MELEVCRSARGHESWSVDVDWLLPTQSAYTIAPVAPVLDSRDRRTCETICTHSVNIPRIVCRNGLIAQSSGVRGQAAGVLHETPIA